jgi:hypothetical protein
LVGAPFFIPANFMELLAIDQLELRDPAGQPVLLRNFFQNYLLLIFLRHLA